MLMKLYNLFCWHFGSQCIIPDAGQRLLWLKQLGFKNKTEGHSGDG